MNRIKQHRPGFVDMSDAPKVVEFETVEELLNISFVKSFSEYNDFNYYAVSDGLLMAIYKDGKEWWVIGYLNDSNIDLPRWIPGKMNN